MYLVVLQLYNNLDSSHNERSAYSILGVQKLFNITKSGIQVVMVLEYNALVEIDHSNLKRLKKSAELTNQGTASP